MKDMEIAGETESSIMRIDIGALVEPGFANFSVPATFVEKYEGVCCAIYGGWSNGAFTNIIKILGDVGGIAFHEDQRAMRIYIVGDVVAALKKLSGAKLLTEKDNVIFQSAIDIAVRQMSELLPNQVTDLKRRMLLGAHP